MEARLSIVISSLELNIKYMEDEIKKIVLDNNVLLFEESDKKRVEELTIKLKETKDILNKLKWVLTGEKQ